MGLGRLRPANGLFSCETVDKTGNAPVASAFIYSTLQYGNHPRSTSPHSNNHVLWRSICTSIHSTRAYTILEAIYNAEHDDNRFKGTLAYARFIVHNVISEAGDPNLKERLRSKPEFEAYIMPGSHGERELIKLLRSTAKHEVPWKDLFENGTLLSFHPFTPLPSRALYSTSGGISPQTRAREKK